VALLLNRAQTTLFVANAQSDTISEVNTATNAIKNTILLRPAGASSLPGVTPTGLALSPDEATLFATLGDMNAVAVIDPNPSAATPLKGYIPVGWYPTSVVALAGAKPGGNVLLVANGKGTNQSIDYPGASGNPNPRHVRHGPPAILHPENKYYVQSIIEGTVERFDTSDPTFSLENATTQVARNNRIGAIAKAADPITLQAHAAIKHVIYIIKENRTYDQVLGDVAGGNGEASLALFGKSVTPNQHALAGRFVLLDNFYDCGEVSGDGWNWSTSSFANESVVKNVPYKYSNRGREFDFEGQNNGLVTGGFPATGADGKPLGTLLFPSGAPAIVDVSAGPSGHIWDLAHDAGISYRNYGMFCASPSIHNLVPENYPASANLRPGGHYEGGRLNPEVHGHTDLDYRRFDLNYADSDGPLDAGSVLSMATYGQFNSKSRFAEWAREFKLMLASDKTGDNVPSLVLMRAICDHTSGDLPGAPTPAAQVADNDYAVGQIVQAVSNSPIWNSTAIFIIEDDAQDGPDHVDCHRSTCYVISPWIKAHSVDHTFYNTDSVLRTIELLLRLAPMSQYDAAATPLGNWDTAPNNNEAFDAHPAAPSIMGQVAARRIDPDDPMHALALASEKLDFSHEDAAPAQVLNDIIWKSVRGADSVMPSPRRGLIPAGPIDPDHPNAPTSARRHDDDDD
jgi:DNA-binding beta-propeller fold protein YncE